MPALRGASPSVWEMLTGRARVRRSFSATFGRRQSYASASASASVSALLAFARAPCPALPMPTS